MSETSVSQKQAVRSKKYKPHDPCFYCGALIGFSQSVGDHMPIPEKCGGVLTVPCCHSCHDMKDRFAYGSWPIEWAMKVVGEMPSLSREMKIYIAKMMKIMFEQQRLVEQLSAKKEVKNASRS